ncbi:hypothetical protein [uncultured Desulfobacter sp.]|uniref:hypothetical protein n=1 Tax=uncultured Desulfobacter sp. TaxID=240139 RepID=UPI002AAAD0B5|nr:hypothetical protein [uncultured Desulfobacter sp.]
MNEDFIEVGWSMLSKKGKMSSKQISIRLPLELEAQIDNLLSLYPNVPKNQIICDLVSLGVKKLSVAHNG